MEGARRLTGTSVGKLTPSTNHMLVNLGRVCYVYPSHSGRWTATDSRHRYVSPDHLFDMNPSGWPYSLTHLWRVNINKINFHLQDFMQNSAQGVGTVDLNSLNFFTRSSMLPFYLEHILHSCCLLPDRLKHLFIWQRLLLKAMYKWRYNLSHSR